MTIVKYHNYNNIVGFQKQNLVTKLLITKEFIRDEFIYGGHLIACATSALALSAMIIFGVNFRWEFLLIIYLGSLCIYNYDHYREIENDSLNNFKRTDHLKKYKKFHSLILTIYGIGFFSLLIYFGTFESIVFGGLLFLSSLLYTKKVKKHTEKLIGFKNFYTAFSFALLTIFTAIYCSYQLNWLLFTFFLIVFLNVLIDTSFCDIKDMETDKKQNLLTLPLYLGKQKFISLLHLFNFILFGLLLIALVIQILPFFSIFLIFSTLFTFYYIQKSKNSKTDIQSLSNLMVDGGHLSWPIVLFVGKTFLKII
ncbi:MAG: UbiA family prenyltransferase [Euryarchaeota archaeon]|nr:UbiA family prenyltransferase [Euryarchaeota archaeon]